MALYKGSEPVAGLAVNTIVTGFNIFDCKWSDHIINDIQWLRADTFSWQSGDVYTTAYNKLVEEYSHGTLETEGGVVFTRTTNGFKIADATQEQAILNKYNTDGIAWYYILDTENKRFKLPRTKFGFEGIRTNVGDDIAESLPNITGTETSHFGGTENTSTGAIDIGTASTSGVWGSSSGNRLFKSYKFDASLSSSTYQDNAPVQERATQMYLYFYVGEYAREAIEQTAGITSEQLNSKLDIPTRYIVETSPYTLMPSWYIVYSDGWCEQGGEHILPVAGWGAITLPKPYSSSNYNVCAVNTGTTTTRYTIKAGNADQNSNTTLYLVSGTANTYISWQTSGYLAEGQY